MISEINSNDKAQAYAYWDDATGKLSITSKQEGASYINIEAGTSNFTDVMALQPVNGMKTVQLSLQKCIQKLKNSARMRFSLSTGQR